MFSLANFAKSSLNADIAIDASSVTLKSGEGASFPQTGDFRAVIWSASYSMPLLDENREIVTGTLDTGDTFTITRGKEGTSAKAWSANDNFAVVLTKGVLDDRADQNLKQTDSPTFTGLNIDDDTLYVDSINHRIGIGTTSPSFKLDVNGGLGFGNAYSTGVYASDYNVCSVKTTTTDTQSGFPTTINVDSTAGFPSKGNLVIGTNAYVVKYTGTTSTSFTGCDWGMGSGTGYVSGDEVFEGGIFTMDARDEAEVPSNYYPLFYIKGHSGSIRIDRNAGDWTFQNNLIYGGGMRNYSGTLALSSGQQDVTITAGGGAGDYIILNGGNVGIGTTNPTAELDVSGDIAVSGLVDNVDIAELKDISDYADSPQIVSGGEISAGSNSGTFKVSALTALLRKTNSETGELVYVTKEEEDNIDITSADTIYIVCLNYNSGSPTISLSETNPYLSDKRNISIGKVMKDGSGNVHFISGGFRFQDGVKKLHQRAIELRELELETGSSIEYKSGDYFTMTAGVVYGGVNRFPLDSYDSSVTTFTPIYGETEGTPRNTIDCSHYYDEESGTLATIGNNKYGCHWVYKHIDDDDVYVVYGRGSYTLAEALLAQEPSKPAHLTSFGCLIGKIIAPKNGGSFAAVQMVTEKFFTGTEASDHGNLTGLTDDDHTQYTLLAGRSGGQTLTGGVATGESLTLRDNPVDNNTISIAEIIAKQDALTFGIADTNAVKIDATDVASGEYARFTANGLEGRSYSEVLSDLSGQAGSAFDWNSKDIVNIGSIGATGTRVIKGWFTDLEVTNTITGDISGNAETATTLTGLTSTITELNKLDGFTGNYLDLNYAKDLRATGVTSTEFDYLDGVTSPIQSQFAGKLSLSGGTMTGYLYARDHGTASTDMVVNVCYGTGDPPTANTTTIGTLFIKYTA